MCSVESLPPSLKLLLPGGSGDPGRWLRGWALSATLGTALDGGLDGGLGKTSARGTSTGRGGGALLHSSLRLRLNDPTLELLVPLLEGHHNDRPKDEVAAHPAHLLGPEVVAPGDIAREGILQAVHNGKINASSNSLLPFTNVHRDVMGSEIGNEDGRAEAKELKELQVPLALLFLHDSYESTDRKEEG